MNNLYSQGYAVKSKSYRQGSLSLYSRRKKVAPPRILLQPLDTKYSPNPDEGISLNYDLKSSKTPLFHAISLNERYSNFDSKSLAQVIGFDQSFNEREDLEETPLTKFQAMTPTKFKNKYSTNSSSVEASPLSVMKTEGGPKVNKSFKYKNFSLGSAGDLDLDDPIMSKGTIEDLRVLLKKLKKPNFS